MLSPISARFLTPKNQAADSERKTRWKRGPVNWTPTSFSPSDLDSTPCTTRPWVEKSASALRESAALAARREAYCEKGMWISRSVPMATSKRVTKAAPLRQRFSLAVSSSKGKPRASRPRTLSGRRTAILRSERCLDTVVLGGTMGWVLNSGDRRAVNNSGDPDPVGVRFLLRDASALEETYDTLEDLRGRARRMYHSTKLAAVTHTMSKPASKLLHFAYTIGQVGSMNLPIVAHQ